jgi:hypothetical protein
VENAAQDKARIAGVSVNMPSSITKAGTLPLGLIAIYSGERCSLFEKSTRASAYSAAVSSKAMCEANAQLPGE